MTSPRVFHLTHAVLILVALVVLVAFAQISAMEHGGRGQVVIDNWWWVDQWLGW